MKAETIPQKEFLELCKSIKESEDKEKFSWDELHKQKDYYAVLEYLSRTNVKYISEGSSRVAFYLPNAIDANGKKIDSPCCLKVASCEDGVFQNKTDIKAYKNFGSKFACFPRIYSWDKNSFYFLCELATPAVDKTFKETIDSKKYFSELKAYIHKEKISPLTYIMLSKIRDLNFFIDSLYDAFETVYPDEERTDVTKKEAARFKKEWIAFWEGLKKKAPKYLGISDICVGFLEQEIYDSDIDHADNWGYVKRNGELVLLPIDFGVGY